MLGEKLSARGGHVRRRCKLQIDFRLSNCVARGAKEKYANGNHRWLVIVITFVEQ